MARPFRPKPIYPMDEVEEPVGTVAVGTGFSTQLGIPGASPYEQKLDAQRKLMEAEQVAANLPKNYEQYLFNDKPYPGMVAPPQIPQYQNQNPVDVLRWLPLMNLLTGSGSGINLALGGLTGQSQFAANQYKQDQDTYEALWRQNQSLNNYRTGEYQDNQKRIDAENQARAWRNTATRQAAQSQISANQTLANRTSSDWQTGLRAAGANYRALLRGLTSGSITDPKMAYVWAQQVDAERKRIEAQYGEGAAGSIIPESAEEAKALEVYNKYEAIDRMSKGNLNARVAAATEFGKWAFRVANQNNRGRLQIARIQDATANRRINVTKQIADANNGVQQSIAKWNIGSREKIAQWLINSRELMNDENLKALAATNGKTKELNSFSQTLEVYKALQKSLQDSVDAIEQRTQLQISGGFIYEEDPAFEQLYRQNLQKVKDYEAQLEATKNKLIRLGNAITKKSNVEEPVKRSLPNARGGASAGRAVGAGGGPGRPSRPRVSDPNTRGIGAGGKNPSPPPAVNMKSSRNKAASGAVDGI